jgi:hypothetical protein
VSNGQLNQGAYLGPPPGTPGVGMLSPSKTLDPKVQAKPSNSMRVEFTTGRFVLWIGALAILWLILSALADSGNADVARALAALIVFGALLALGPGAIGNAKGLVEGS